MTTIEKRSKAPKGISILPPSTIDPLSEQRPYYCSWYGFVFDEPEQPDTSPAKASNGNLSIASKEK